MATGDLEKRRELCDRLKPLLEFIVAGGLATTVKAGLELLGFPVGDPRPPLLPLDGQGPRHPVGAADRRVIFSPSAGAES